MKIPMKSPRTLLACSRPAIAALAAALLTACSGGGAQTGASSPPAAAPISVVELTMADARTAMEQKRLTSRELVTQYLVRLATYEDRVNAALAVNPRALAEADERDRERAQGRIRGPLHGIPVALKDNIHTTDMPTTGGALAFLGYTP